MSQCLCKQYQGPSDTYTMTGLGAVRPSVCECCVVRNYCLCEWVTYLQFYRHVFFLSSNLLHMEAVEWHQHLRPVWQLLPFVYIIPTTLFNPLQVHRTQSRHESVPTTTAGHMSLVFELTAERLHLTTCRWKGAWKGGGGGKYAKWDATHICYLMIMCV